MILVNRSELVEQTARNITKDCFFITAGTNKIELKQVNIGMVESVYNRIKSKKININDFDLIIADEVHNLQFTKIFKGYHGKLLGFTATPITMKTENFNDGELIFKKTFSLSEWYGGLIQGVKISELIEQGYLTQIQNYAIPNENLRNLKIDKSGEFTSKSQDEAFNNVATTLCLYENYIEHCRGQKTMIFNTNIKSNDAAYKYFLEMGINAKSYDSESNESRTEIVNWFKNTRDSVLFSVGVFTTGFDVDDVENIILNRATQSLSLYHQIVGRGGRITDKIFKPFFKLIDLGGNIERFGSWSDDIDWSKTYPGGVKQIVEHYYICDNCFGYVKENPCEDCGYKTEIKQSAKTVKAKHKGIAIQLNDMPIPTAKTMLNFGIKSNSDINAVKNETADYIVRMFKNKGTSKESYYRNEEQLSNKIKQIITPIYFALHNSDLEGNRYRSINDFVRKIIKRLDKYYGED